MMPTPLLATAIGVATAPASTTAASSAGWMILQLFVVFCLTFAALVRLARARP